MNVDYQLENIGKTIETLLIPHILFRYWFIKWERTQINQKSPETWFFYKWQHNIKLHNINVNFLKPKLLTLGELIQFYHPTIKSNWDISTVLSWTIERNLCILLLRDPDIGAFYLGFSCFSKNSRSIHCSGKISSRTNLYHHLSLSWKIQLLFSFRVWYDLSRSPLKFKANILLSRRWEM